MSRVSTLEISSFSWRIAHAVLRDAYVRSATNIRRWIIHNGPRQPHALEETRADILMVDLKTDGLQADIVGGTK